ncbi:restriction endonuclease subunit S [Pseudomonas sp. PS01297]|uniref:restriction endonuclease subunit S n=1 Tax=Pseudomonas sp. PS01297 TaxID=2991433 RepID=UPI00249CEA29|nr:restriction endonuclease subunit S [Pseudomonas sp. PS01297]
MSFPVYPEYKDSGAEWLGEIPQHWKIFLAKRLFRNARDTAQSGSEQLAATQAYGVIPQKDFMEKNDVKVVLALAGTQNFKGVLADDFVISLRSFQGGIEHSAYDGCVSPAYTVLRRNTKNDVYPGLFKYLLKEDAYISALQSVTTGIREGKTITYDQFGSLLLPVAASSEQIQIARFLDHETARIDALIEEQQSLIELLKEKRQAVISHAVNKGLDPSVQMKDSGVDCLGEVPAHWDVSRLKYHSTRIGDGLHSTPEYDDAGDYFFINGNNLAGGVITISPTTRQVNRQEFLKHRVLLDSSTVLISINGTIGNLALYSGEPVILGKSAAYINCTESLSPRFCLYLFSSEQIKRFFESQLTGTTIYNLSLRTIAETPTPLPSIDEQNSIVEFLNRNVSGFDELIDNAMKLAQLLEERRSALISAAVTGKIDVRGWQPPVSVPSPVLEAEAV